MKEKIISSVSEYVGYVESLQNKSNCWFRGVSKPIYLPVPGLIWKKATDVEGSLEHDFLISYKSYIQEQNLNPWELYALMQHHGLPTRLLDWSESSLVALFFALTFEPESTSYRAVWVLNPYELNNATLGESILYCPAIITNREIMANGKPLNIDAYLPPNLRPVGLNELPETPIAINSTQYIKRVSAQKGCFTIHGSNQDGIHTYLTNFNDFHMIKIDSRSTSKRLEMIETLAVLGIDEEFIYQDLDSLCEKIKRTREINLEQDN